MRTSELPRDIFGVTMCVTPKARLKEFHSYFSQLQNIGKYSPQISIVDLLLYVRLGVLSPQSASYFVAGRASDFDVLKLQTFVEHCHSLFTCPFKLLKLIASWQKQGIVAEENTFLFPLAELDSNIDFESERSEYVNIDVKDLQLL